MAKQTEIGYEAPTEYKPYQTGGTLVRAAELNAMNGGISDACAAVDDLRTKRLPTYVVAQDGDTATQDVYMEDILGPCLILDLATRTTYYETGGDEEGHRKAITSGADIDALRDSLSRIEVASTVKKVLFLDVNSNDCPGMTITTTSGHRIGIYAQAGLGFVLYDYTENRRIGICSFD